MLGAAISGLTSGRVSPRQFAVEGSLLVAVGGAARPVDRVFYGCNSRTDVETLTDENGDTKATYGYTAYGFDDKSEFTGIDKPDAADTDRADCPDRPRRQGRWVKCDGWPAGLTVVYVFV